MKTTVLANISGAVTAYKGQEITVTRAQGQELIERGLAVEVPKTPDPVPAQPEAEPHPEQESD